MTDTTPAPVAEMPIWQARSFWVTIGAWISATLALAGEEALGVEFAETFPDQMLAAITAVMGLWAYIERLYGKAKLIL